MFFSSVRLFLLSQLKEGDMSSCKKILVFLFLFFSPGLFAQSWQDTLSAKLDSIWSNGQITGFGVSLYSADTVYFMRGFGYADRQTHRPYTPQTIQKVASVSKLVLAVATLKAVEKGLFSLYDPADEYLPFPLFNPWFPHDTIRIWHLVTHTSGLRQSVFDYKALYFPTKLRLKVNIPNFWERQIYKLSARVLNNNVKMELQPFLTRIFSPKGKWYLPQLNFHKCRPGTKRYYSNIGASLVGLIIQRTSGMSYPAFVRKYVLQPYHLQHTGFDFEFRGIPDTLKSHLYHFGVEVPNDYLLLITPAGGLESNVEDFTAFMQHVMKSTSVYDSILSTVSYQMMIKRYYDPNLYQGIFWRVWWDGRAGHRGDLAGATTFAYFYKEYGTGYILFSNTAGGKSVESELHDITRLLEHYALVLGRENLASSQPAWQFDLDGMIHNTKLSYQALLYYQPPLRLRDIKRSARHACRINTSMLYHELLVLRNGADF